MMNMRGNHLIIGSKLTTYTLYNVLAILLVGLSVLSECRAQGSVAAKAIVDLREGYLLIRLPAYRTKIDTLESFVARATDPANKARLEKLLHETIESRDSLHNGYLRAFRTEYHFSKVAYFYDYDAHNLNTANYFNLDGERIAIGDIMDKPIFYLTFERTADSKIEALVIYDRMMKFVPRPFPNNFSRGGLNILFLKLADKSFPVWRVSKMQKQLIKYYNAVKMMEES